MVAVSFIGGGNRRILRKDAVSSNLDQSEVYNIM
jgi:hypothetical protein